MNSTTAQTTADTAEETILDKVRSFITDYVSLPGEHYADVLALYVLHTHAFDCAKTTPYIYVTSQGPGSGKTRVLEVLMEVANSGLMTSGLTGATLFRAIEARRPTLFLDEVDTIYSGAKNEELRGVLNSGYKHNGKVLRVDNSSEDGMRDFSTFCPKVLAGIDNGQVPDTVIDRSVRITLAKAKPGQVQPFYAEDVEDLAADLIDEIRAWVAANRDYLLDRANRPAPVAELNDRQNDIVRPLLTIADRFRGWHQRARQSCTTALTAQATPLTPPAVALLKVRDYMTAHDLTRISSTKVAEITGAHGKQIGTWFRAFGINTNGTYIIEGKNRKGYRLAEDGMQEAFDRFLPAPVE
jgi:hypothetical protein